MVARNVSRAGKFSQCTDFNDLLPNDRCFFCFFLFFFDTECLRCLFFLRTVQVVEVEGCQCRFGHNICVSAL